MKKPFLFFIAMLFIFAAADLYADEGKPIITVLDFEANNISTADMKSITTFLAAALFDTGSYTVIDTAQRDNILKELEFSLSGCTDESCQLEVGKMLSAELIVVGNIGKIGDRIIITCKILETETTETVQTAKGVYEDVTQLIDNISFLAETLSGNQGAEQTAAASGKDPENTNGAESPAGKTLPASEGDILPGDFHINIKTVYKLPIGPKTVTGIVLFNYGFGAQAFPMLNVKGFESIALGAAAGYSLFGTEAETFLSLINAGVAIGFQQRVADFLLFKIFVSPSYGFSLYSGSMGSHFCLLGGGDVQMAVNENLRLGVFIGYDWVSSIYHGSSLGFSGEYDLK